MFLPKFTVNPAGVKWTSRDGKEWSFLFTAKHTTFYHTGQGVPASSFPPLSFMNYLSKVLVAFPHPSNKHPPNTRTFHHVASLPLPYFIWTMIAPDRVIKYSRKLQAWERRHPSANGSFESENSPPLFPSLNSFHIREVSCSLDSLVLTTRNQTGCPREKDTHRLHFSAHFLGLFIYPQ